MAKQEITLGGGDVKYIKAKELTEGEIFSGTFLGTSLSPKYKKPSH